MAQHIPAPVAPLPAKNGVRLYLNYGRSLKKDQAFGLTKDLRTGRKRTCISRLGSSIVGKSLKDFSWLIQLVSNTVTGAV